MYYIITPIQIYQAMGHKDHSQGLENSCNHKVLHHVSGVGKYIINGNERNIRPSLYLSL